MYVLVNIIISSCQHDSIFEQSLMFFEQCLINKNEKNKEVGMLLPKKELIQVK